MAQAFIKLYLCIDSQYVNQKNKNKLLILAFSV